MSTQHGYGVLPVAVYSDGMCRSIKTLRGAEPPADDDEIRAAALQFIRKVSGYRAPSAANRPAFETPYAGAWAGARDGDVVLVEFFDYACGYCRRSNADLDRLLKEDPKLKIVWRDWPILGPDSEAAAKSSLAAAAAGRFKPFHDRLFAAGRPTPAATAAAERATGLGAAAPPPNADTELARNYDLARAIGANGTPTFVVGDRILRGAVGYDLLKAAIAEARERG